MSTLENLLIRIFERKKWIIEQVQQQTELYDQHIASKLLIEGIHPPPWLISSVHNSDIRDSQVNLQESRLPDIFHPEVSCSQLVGSSVKNPANEFPDSVIDKKCSSYGVGAVNLATDPQIASSSDAFDPITNAALASPSDRTGISPYNKSGTFSSIIHRSRSRQKAFELRNSSKKGTRYDSKKDVDQNHGIDSAVLSKTHEDLVSSGKIIELLESIKSITDDNNVVTCVGMNNMWKEKASHSYACTNTTLENSIRPQSVNKISNPDRMRRSSSGSSLPSDHDDKLFKLSGSRNGSFVDGEESIGIAKGNVENEEHTGMPYSSVKATECSDPHIEFVSSHQHGQDKTGCDSAGKMNDLVEDREMGKENEPCLTEIKNLSTFHNENNESRSLILNVDHPISERSFGNCISSNNMNKNVRPAVSFIGFEETPGIMEHIVPISTSCPVRVSEKPPDFINESFSVTKNTMADAYVNDKSNSYCGRITRSRSCHQKKSDGSIGSPVKPGLETNTMGDGYAIDKSDSYCGRTTRSRSCRQKKSDGNIGSPVKPDAEIILLNKSPFPVNSEGDYKERKTKSSNFIHVRNRNAYFGDSDVDDNLRKESHGKASTDECVIPDYMCNFDDNEVEENFRKESHEKAYTGDCVLHDSMYNFRDNEADYNLRKKSLEGDCIIRDSIYNFSGNEADDNLRKELHEGDCIIHDSMYNFSGNEADDNLGKKSHENASTAEFIMQDSMCNLIDNKVDNNLRNESHEKASTSEFFISDSIRKQSERKDENTEQSPEEILHERASPVSVDGCLGSCTPSRSPCHVHSNIAHVNDTFPLSEASVMQTEDDEILDTRYGINLDVFNLPNSVMERANVLELICRSSSRNSPISQFPNLYKLNGMPDFDHSHSNEIGEGSYELNRDTEKQLTELYAMDSPFPGAVFSLDNNRTCTSPVRKIWDGGSTLFSSENTKIRRSFNPSLTCFPIKEEDNGTVDGAVDTFQDDGVLSSVPDISEGDFPTETTEKCTNSLALLTDINSESVEYLNAGTGNNYINDEVERKIEDHRSRKRTHVKDSKDDRFLSVGPNSSIRKRESPRNRISKQKLSRNAGSLKNKATCLLEDLKHNNIIHNITSFVPLVHQKQPSTAFTGKRDIKVKALEAAEAAKRLEEKKETERKLKKEALKLERARIDQKKKLETKKKEEELKRKDTIAATNKRKREAGVSMGKKMKQDAKIHKKEDKKLHIHKENQTSDEREKSEVEIEMGEHIEKGMIRDIDISKTRLSTSYNKKASTVFGNCEASLDWQDGGKVRREMNDLPDTHMVAPSQEEQSYELSPYRGSDDEDDEDRPTRKLIPGWASKKNLARLMSLQQGVDLTTVFQQRVSPLFKEFL